MSTLPAEPQITLDNFNPASRALSPTDIFYVWQAQYGEVALPASFILAYVQKYLGAGIFVTNGAPDNSQGVNEDYALDLNTGIWYGPKTSGEWPSNTGTMVAGSLSAQLAAQIEQQIAAGTGDGTVILGAGAPPSTLGSSGQIYLDTQNGIIYGPYANGAWPAGQALLASALSAALQNSILQDAVGEIESALAATTGASTIGYNNTTVAAELGELSSQIGDLQVGTGGSALTLTATSMEITSAHVNRIVVFEGTGIVDPVFTMDPGSSFQPNTVVSVTNKSGNPDSVLSLTLSGNGDYFSTGTYSPTNTGITTVALQYGDTLKIGLTQSNNFVLLDGTAVLQFSSTQASAPDLSDVSNQIATTAFGKTLRHGAIELALTSGTPYTVMDDQAAYAILICTGELTADTEVYLPNRAGTYTLRNETTGGFNIILSLDESNTDSTEIGPSLALYAIVRAGAGVYAVSSAQDVTSPALTIFNTTLGNVVAGATTLPMGALVSNLTNIFANGAFLTRGMDFSYDGRDINLTTPVVAGVSYVVLSSTLINTSSLLYTPAIVPLTLPAGTTTLTYPYPVGFVDVYVAGSYQTAYSATDGQTIVFNNSFGTDVQVVLRIYTPVAINGMLPLSGGTIGGNLAVNGVLTINGNVPLTQANMGALALYTAPGTGAISQTLQRRLQTVLYASDYGVVGDGVTDNTAVLTELINYALSLSYGVKIDFGRGYFVTGPLPQITGPLTFTGDNPRTCQIMGKGAANIFQVQGLTTRTTDVIFENIGLNGSAMTGGFMVAVDFAQSIHFKNTYWIDPYNGVSLRQCGDIQFVSCLMDAVRGTYGVYAYATNTARNGQNDQIDILIFTNTVIQSNYIAGGAVPTAMLLVLDGRVHTVQFDGLRLLNAYQGLVTLNSANLASNFVPRFLTGSSLESENMYAQCLALNYFSDVWLHNLFAAGSVTTDGVVLGAGTNNFRVSKGSINSHWLAGLNNLGAYSVNLTDVDVYNNSLVGSGVKSGIISAGTSVVVVKGGVAGKAGWLPTYTENQKYGIDFAADFGGIVIADDVDLRGNAVGPIYTGAGFSAGSWVEKCLGVNPGGANPVTVGASGSVYTAGLTTEAITLYGGAGVVSTTGGVVLANASPCSFTLAPLQPVTITYTSAPTMVRNKL